MFRVSPCGLVRGDVRFSALLKTHRSSHLEPVLLPAGPALLDRINAGIKQLAAFAGRLTRLLQTKGLDAAQPHIARATLDLKPEDPISGPAGGHSVIESAAIAIEARTPLPFNFQCGKLLYCHSRCPYFQCQLYSWQVPATEMQKNEIVGFTPKLLATAGCHRTFMRTPPPPIPCFQPSQPVSTRITVRSADPMPDCSGLSSRDGSVALAAGYARRVYRSKASKTALSPFI